MFCLTNRFLFWIKEKWNLTRNANHLNSIHFFSNLSQRCYKSELLILSGHLLTLEETAVLAVNLKLINMITQVLQRVPGSAGPIMMNLVGEDDKERYRFWWMGISKVTLLLSILAAGCYVTWSEYLIKHL